MPAQASNNGTNIIKPPMLPKKTIKGAPKQRLNINPKLV
jgi:hypothetical protein